MVQEPFSFRAFESGLIFGPSSAAVTAHTRPNAKCSVRVKAGKCPTGCGVAEEFL